VVERQHVRERHAPQIVIADEQPLERTGQIPPLGGAERAQRRVRVLRRHVALIGIPGEVGQEGDRGIVLDDDSAAVTFWGKAELKTALTKALKLLEDHK